MSIPGPKSFKDCIRSGTKSTNKFTTPEGLLNATVNTSTNSMSPGGFRRWFRKAPRASIDGGVPNETDASSIVRAKTYPVTQSIQSPTPEWRRGAISVRGLSTGSTNIRPGAAQLITLIGPARPSEQSASLACECRPIAHAPGSHVDRMGSFTYCPQQRQHEPTPLVSITNHSSSVPEILQEVEQDSDGGDTVKDHIEPSPEEVTQTRPETPTIKPPAPPSPPLIFPACNPGEVVYWRGKLSVSPALVPTSSSRDSNGALKPCRRLIRALEIQTKATGYQHDDPTVLWAHLMPPAIVPPGRRHRSLDLTTDPRTNPLSARYDADLTAGPDAPFVSSVTATTPHVTPDLLTEYLVEKNARIAAHAVADVWRKEHAAAVIERYNSDVFARAPAEGDFLRRGWLMSAEYHGQKAGRGRGGRGRAGRRGGRVALGGGGAGAGQAVDGASRPALSSGRGAANSGGSRRPARHVDARRANGAAGGGRSGTNGGGRGS